MALAEIRLVRQEELEQINRLRAQAAALHNQGRPDIYPPFSLALAAQLAERLQDPGAELVAAFRQGSAAGYALVLYREIPSTPHSVGRRVCHIDEFGVDEDCRRQKIGAQLLDFIKARAAEKGFSQIQLNVWGFNQSAIAFYQRMGFEPVRYFMELQL